MVKSRSRRTLALAAAVLAVAAGALPAYAQTGTQVAAVTPPKVSYQGAQFVQVSLGETDQEMGLQLVPGAADGETRHNPDVGGRQSVANPAGTDRFFYFDVNDTYINGGENKVVLTITYRDMGLTPIYMEYDSFDPVRPAAKLDEVTKKRVPVASRTNTEGWKTAWIELSDVRFAGGQPGGADFRIGSSDDLVILNTSVRLIAHKDPPPAIRVLVNGREIIFDPNDVQPFANPATSRTLVPFRAFFTALGVANEDIVWHQATRTVETRLGQTIILLPIDGADATVNGRSVRLEQPAAIVGGRTVVPVRFVADQFNLDINWIQETHTVVLTAKRPY